MKTLLCTTPKFGLFFVVAFLALQATPAAADSGSGTFTGADRGKPFTVKFKDVYAFRAEDKYDKTEQVTVVFLTDSSLDKKAITATLKKERSWGVVTHNFPNKMAFATLQIDQHGSIKEFYFYPGNYTLNRGKSEAVLAICRSELKECHCCPIPFGSINDSPVTLTC